MKLKLFTTSLLICICSLISFAQDEVFEVVDQMPYFNGCDTHENGSDEKRNCSNVFLVDYLAGALQYPESAMGTGLEGTVYVSFVVDKLGKIVQAKVLRDIGGGCGEEAIRVINSMPDWEPGVVNGENVNVMLKIPLNFSLKDEEPDWSDEYKIQWGNINDDNVSKKDLKANLKEEVLVRDKFGDGAYVTDLVVIFERNGNFSEGRSKGYMSKSLQKVIKKAKPGGVLTITATLQHNGEFILVGRSYNITD